MDLSFLFNQDPALNTFHGALSKGLETYGNIAKAAYAIPSMKADLEKKQAYSNYMDRIPAQYIASVLGNPNLAPLLGDHIDPLINSLLSFANKGTKPVERPSLMHQLYEKVMGTAPSQPTSLSSLPPSQLNPPEYVQNSNDYSGPIPEPTVSVEQTNVPRRTENRVPVYVDNATDTGIQNYNINPETGEVSQGASVPQGQPYSPTGNYPGNKISPNSPAATTVGNRAAFLSEKYPSTPYKQQVEIDTEEKKAEARERGKSNVADLNKLNNEAAKVTDEATKTIQDIENFHNLYKNAWFVGPIAGHLAKYGSTSPEIKRIASTLQVNMANQLFGTQGQKISDYRERLAGETKPSEMTGHDSEKLAYQNIKAQAFRQQKYQDFVNYLQQNGIKKEADIKSFWNQYNSRVPFYDPVAKVPLQDTDTQYKTFINEYLRTGQLPKLPPAQVADWNINRAGAQKYNSGQVYRPKIEGEDKPKTYRPSGKRSYQIYNEETGKWE